LPGATAPTLFTREEPAQQGERRVTVERPGHTAFVRIAHRTPSAIHPDWFALTMLDSVLTGPGGNIDNKTSRLYRRLVSPGIAAGISGSIEETIDPYLYNIGATVSDGRTLEETEALIVQEISRIQQDGITVAELEKAKKQARASFAYATERVTNQAYWLAQSAMLGDIHWFDQFIDRVSAVTLADIQSVAQRYLTPRTRVVGWLVPTGMEDETWS
jgi:zinc protease